MPSRSRYSFTANLLPLAAVAAAGLLLAGCAGETTVLSSANPSRQPAAAWSDYDSLPVAVRGVVPGHSKAELAALFPAYHAPQYASLGDLPASGAERRMVLFVNPAHPLGTNDLCDGRAPFTRSTQAGESAYVVGALCDGSQVVSSATAYIRTKDETAAGLAYNFNTIRDQLYQSLFPGANDPDRYYEGYP